MNPQFKKFIFVIIVFISSFIAMPLLGRYAPEYVGYMIFMAFVILLPALVLVGRDTLVVLNETNEGSIGLRFFLRVMAGLPAFVFGVLGLVIGITIIGWILYNYFIERQPSFTGGYIFSGFGIAPVAIYFGYASLRSLFKIKDTKESDLH